MPSPWPHRLAVMLVCAVFPLIWVGGLVTTYDAGMAVPDWPTTYGYNMFLYPWQTWIYGPWDLFIEHGHRLLGAAVGLIAIALATVLWRCDARRWMHFLGLAAAAAVASQGLLGGLRVRLDERLLAQIHACLGPACFALAVAMAVFTSRRWQHWAADSAQRRSAENHAALGKLARLGTATVLLAYVQLLLGSQIRHAPVDLSASMFRATVLFHLLVAGVLTAHVLLLAVRALGWRPREPWLVRPALALGGLMVFQLALGCGSWIVNYGWPAWFANQAWAERYVVTRESPLQALVTTAHVAVGSLILVTALTVALRSLRLGSGMPAGSRPQARAGWEAAA